MAYVLDSARPVTGFAQNSPLNTLVLRVKAAIQTRARRKAMHYLLTLDDSRLEDIGLSRADIREALNSGGNLTRH